LPELPDVTIYVEAIARRIVGEPLTAYAILNVFACAASSRRSTRSSVASCVG
jgi:hypothetical protein